MTYWRHDSRWSEV